ncbi:uncharacterized protein [Epargyreus clarus]|uniref:uncharacterized protein n=1 Tax=Epargyreus clarus TaxID=520877 RepID=UPI003C2F6F32
MNLADPELELIDPTPNVHSMFMHFDRTFFWATLASRCIVRWSKRMYSCAGICSYEGRAGLCDIALSEPLLKLRPRKDLVETLLHEMIHAFLFITCRDQDRDGHGPNFQAHMHRINRAAGVNITIYHDFHDEVKLYQTHWWRCNGPCQTMRPYFGIVKRAMNRAPGPSDYWWDRHQRSCGGTFIKIKEPEKQNKKTNVAKPNADITKYITNNNNKEVNNKNIVRKDKPNKPVLKDSSNILVKPNTGVKSNSSSTLVVTKKNVIFNPKVPKPNPGVFSGRGKTVFGVVETVTNAWAHKQIPTNNNKPKLNNNNIATSPINGKTVFGVVETVTNAWANKQIHTNNNKPKLNNNNIATSPINGKTVFGVLETVTNAWANKQIPTNNNKPKLNNNNIATSPNGKTVFGVVETVTNAWANKQICTNNNKPKLNNNNIATSPNGKTVFGVLETVTNAWANKQIRTNNNKPKLNNNNIATSPINASKHKSDTLITSPPSKIKKIDDYFTTTATSVLKDLYGQDFNITQSKNDQKFIALPKKVHLVDCPVCNGKIDSNEINNHLDECLNKSVIDDLTKDSTPTIKSDSSPSDKSKVNNEITIELFPKNKNNDNDVNRKRSRTSFDESNLGKPVDTKIKSDDYVLTIKPVTANPKTSENTLITSDRPLKVEPGCSNPNWTLGHECPCCGDTLNMTVEEHLDECLSFFDNKTTIPEEGASTSSIETIVIDDDDDEFDETLTLNATGTKLPCPSCLKMVEEIDMSTHLEKCLC